MKLKYLLISLSILATGIVWTYVPAIEAAADRWSNDPQYSHGYLIPLFSLFLLWRRRTTILEGNLSPNAIGFAFLLVGLSVRALSVYLYLTAFDLISLIPVLAGGAIVVGGWTALRWSWPSIGFLCFMVPLPYRIQTALSSRLQNVSTELSTYILQTLGVSAVQEGNVIVLDDVRIGVVEACSGLGMMMTFVAISVAITLLIRSSYWVKLCLVLGSLPIAIISNVVRITVTGLLFQADQDEAARTVFHDLAGWLMMPLGILLILLHLLALERLVIPRNNPRREIFVPIEFGKQKPVVA